MDGRVVAAVALLLVLGASVNGPAQAGEGPGEQTSPATDTTSRGWLLAETAEVSLGVTNSHHHGYGSVSLLVVGWGLGSGRPCSKLGISTSAIEWVVPGLQGEDRTTVLPLYVHFLPYVQLEPDLGRPRTTVDIYLGGSAWAAPGEAKRDEDWELKLVGDIWYARAGIKWAQWYRDPEEPLSFPFGLDLGIMITRAHDDATAIERSVYLAAWLGKGFMAVQ